MQASDSHRNASRQTLANEAEAVVLGTLLTIPGAMERIEPPLHEADFGSRTHRLVYAAICRVDGAGQGIDTVSVAAALDQDAALEQCGGVEALVALAEKAGMADIQRAAATVRDKALTRGLLVAGDAILKLARAEGPAHDKLGRAQDLLTGVIDCEVSGGPVVARSLLADLASRVEALSLSGGGVTGLPSGLPDLDRLTTGLHGGQLVVLAGRPGMGKTSLGMQLALHAAMNEKQTALVFSLEMTASDLLLRCAAGLGHLDVQHLIGGGLDQSGLETFVDATAKLSGIPLYLDDGGRPTMLDIRTRARRIKREHGLSLLMIDYLQLMDCDGENRNQKIAQLSREAKLLAKELDVPVLLLSQLNRGLEFRDDRRPRVSDLRDSGAIEQDADLILLLYRDEVYRPDTPHPGMAELIIGKQRNGPTGTVYLGFEPGACVFSTHAGPDAYPPPLPRARACRGFAG